MPADILQAFSRSDAAAVCPSSWTIWPWSPMQARHGNGPIVLNSFHNVSAPDAPCAFTSECCASRDGVHNVPGDWYNQKETSADYAKGVPCPPSSLLLCLRH